MFELARGTNMGQNKDSDSLDIFDPAKTTHGYCKNSKKIMFVIFVLIAVAVLIHTYSSQVGRQKTEVTSFV